MAEEDKNLHAPSFQSLIGDLLNHLYRYANEDISMKSMFNLHYLCFNNHLLAQK